MKRFYIILIFCLFAFNSWSQEYKRMMTAGTYTVQEIITEAEAYFTVRGKQRGTGYNPYKRWEYQALRNCDENGMLKTPEFYFNELENYNNFLNQNNQAFRAAADVGNWEELGPNYKNQSGGWNPGVGRVTSFAVDKTNQNHMIIGGESGGVWKTLDGGANWTVLTDNLSNLWVYALAIDPTNSSTYFWGSTSGNIFKSTDGGATWNLFADTGSGNVNKILIDPTNTNKMYCSVEGGGIFKSTNGGLNWSVINGSANNGYDVEFKPGDTNTIYASGNNVYLSTDGGTTFNQITGFSNGAKMIGVSEADPTVVYVVQASNGAFGGFFKSVNSGASFTALDHTNKNYFGYRSDPQDPQDVGQGQAPRDMDIVVNPTNINDVHIAGINTWRSTNGGVSFSISSQWVPQSAAAQNIGYCHADVDIMEFVGSTLYVGTDGGIFKATNPEVVNSTYYTDLTVGAGIRQFYKIGVSQTNPAIITGGSQDNGTSVYSAAGLWTDWLGADGMETFVDKNNSNILYGTSQYGSLYRSNNGGASYSDFDSPDLKSGNWVTPFEQDPITPNTIYTGYNQVYKSTDSGNTWTAVSQVFSSNLDHLKVAPTNSNFMYAARGNALYKNALVGVITNWSQLTGFSGSINSIAIHPTNPNKVAIATTGAQKVYVSTNGGSTWTSYLYDLPNFTAQALVWENNGKDGLYVGMNYGVYYIDNESENSWQPFSNNLPNVIISELEINYEDNMLYAATYGRGLWRTSLYDPNLSVDEFEVADVKLYPNPASNEVTLSWNKGENVSVKVFDNSGKLVHFSTDVSLQNNYKINTSAYVTGLYFVKINSNVGEITKKLIIE
uniref:T9SS type A sorting domain-containing protein n=1 Tax=Gelidibacter sp. TaxID=2018083 RepID=UPI00404A3922